MARRLWARFEVLPFRYGVTLLAGVFAAAVLVVGGLVTLGGGSSTARTPGRASHRPPAEAALPSAPTWGAYVPPRKTKPPPALARPRIASIPPRPRTSHAAPRSSPSLTCPPSLRKWTWLWEMCKRKQNG